MRMGNGQINVNPCTESEVRGNWPIIKAKIAELEALIEGSTVTDDKKVAVNATDFGNATFDYLHAKIKDPGTYDVLTDLVVRATTVTNSHERLYWSPTDIIGYDDTDTWHLTLNDGAMEWAQFSSVIDSFTVMITAGDTVPSYLHDAFNLNAAYDSTCDILIATETVGASSTNQKERPFVDVSTITNYNASGSFVLVLENDVTSYQAYATFTANLLSSITLVGMTFSGGTLRAGYHMVRGLVKGAVLAGATSFPIDNIETLASGLDPRSNPADKAEELTIHRGFSPQKEPFADNTPVTAIYDLAGTNGPRWELLLTERYRMIRGKATAAVITSDPTFTIDGIVVLASGLDPRTDTTSASETVTITNTPAQSYSDNDDVWASFNAKDNVWNPIKSGSSGGDTLVRYKITSSCPAATGWAVADNGEGLGVPVLSDGTFGAEVTLYNEYFDIIPEDATVRVDSSTNVIRNAGCNVGP